MRLRTRLLIATLTITVGPLLGLSTYSYVQADESLTAAAHDSLDDAADVEAVRLGDLITAQEDKISLIVSRTALRTTLAEHLQDPQPEHVERMTRIMSDAKAAVDGIISLHVVDVNGQEVAGTRPGGDWSDHAAFKEGFLATRADVLVRDDDGVLRWYAGAPLDLDGGRLGVLIMVHHALEVFDLVHDRAGLGGSGEVIAMRAIQGGFEVLNPLRYGRELHIFQNPGGVEYQAADQLGAVEGEDYRGEVVLAVGRSVEGTDLVVVTKIDRDEALAERDDLLTATAIAVGIVGSAAVIAALLITRSISAPLDRVAHRAQALGEQHGMEPLPRSTNEIDQLALSVDAMAEAVLAERGRLEERVRERTADLEEARHAAEGAERAKTTFLASMSHEIRTPMNAIIGLTDVLLAGKLPAEQRDTVRSIQQSGDHLLQVINQVLDFSKIEAGKLDMQLGAGAPRMIIEAACDIIDPVAAGKSTVVGWDVADDVPAWIETDSGRLRQVLVNLMSNAVKAAPGGRVDVRAAMDQGLLTFEVQDDGVGIAKEDQARLFEAFEQVQAGGVPREGTGLGLAITHRIVDALGGTVEIESQPGAGSTFRVVLPVEEMEAPAAELEQEVSDTPKRVLVADDSVTNRRVAKLLLEGLGHHVVTVPDGQDVFRLVDQDVFDVLLIDLEMERVHGLAVAQRLRRHEARGRMEVIAFTAHVGAAVEQAVKAAGFDRLLTKPATRDMLAAVVGDASSGNGDEVTDEPSEQPASNDLPDDLLEDLRLDIADGITALRAADDAAAGAKALHGIKGVLLTVGLDDAADDALQMELAAKDGTVHDEAAIDAFAARLDAVLQSAG